MNKHATKNARVDSSYLVMDETGAISVEKNVLARLLWQAKVRRNTQNIGLATAILLMTAIRHHSPTPFTPEGLAILDRAGNYLCDKLRNIGLN